MGKRSAKVQRAYEVQRRRWIATYGSVEEGILQTVLGRDQDTRIVPNMFPYKMPKGMRHYVLWSKAGPLSTESVREHIGAAFGEDAIYFTHDNPRGDRSVKGIWHIHVFVCL